MSDAGAATWPAECARQHREPSDARSKAPAVSGEPRVRARRGERSEVPVEVRALTDARRQAAPRGAGQAPQAERPGAQQAERPGAQQAARPGVPQVARPGVRVQAPKAVRSRAAQRGAAPRGVPQEVPERVSTAGPPQGARSVAVRAQPAAPRGARSAAQRAPKANARPVHRADSPARAECRPLRTAVPRRMLRRVRSASCPPARGSRRRCDRGGRRVACGNWLVPLSTLLEGVLAAGRQTRSEGAKSVWT